MIKPIKAILIDVDGTLVKSDRTFSAQVKASIDRAQDNHLIVGLSTGRHHVALSAVFDWLGWRGLHVVAGGAQVFDAATKQVVWQKAMNSKRVHTLYQEIHSRGAEMVFGRDDALYGYTKFVERMIEHPWKIPVKKLEDLDEDWHTALVSVHELNPAVIEYLDHQDQLHAVRMKTGQGFDYYDVTLPGVSKLMGITIWAEHHGLKLEEIMAIGDGLNDKEMFTAVGLSVAMGNAHPDLKEIADYQVADNDRDGVAEAIDWLLQSP